MRRERGFTLLEVLVATTIMAIAVGTLLGALSTSVRNASRVTESDRAAVLAKRVMDDILAGAPLAAGTTTERQWDPRETNINGGWRARAEPFEGYGGKTLDRIVLEVWWMSGAQRRSFQLEAYRVGGLQPGGPR